MILRCGWCYKPMGGDGNIPISDGIDCGCRAFYFPEFLGPKKCDFGPEGKCVVCGLEKEGDPIGPRPEPR